MSLLVVRASAAAWITAGGIACSLLVDSGGLSEGSPSSSVDGATDAILSDSGGPSPASDGGVSSADCGATFCDDFDDGKIGARWTRNLVTFGNIELVPSDRSPPNAMRATILDEKGASAQLEKEFSSFARVRCTFAMKVVKHPIGAWVEAFVVYARSPSVAEYQLNYAVVGDGSTTSLREDLNLLDGSCDCPRKHLVLPPFPTSWAHVDIALDFTTHVAKVVVDDVIVLESAFSAGVTPTHLAVRVGAFGYREAPAELHYDDVRCDAF